MKKKGEQWSYVLSTEKKERRYLTDEGRADKKKARGSLPLRKEEGRGLYQ